MMHNSTYYYASCISGYKFSWAMDQGFCSYSLSCVCVKACGWEESGPIHTHQDQTPTAYECHIMPSNISQWQERNGEIEDKEDLLNCHQDCHGRVDYHGTNWALDEKFRLNSFVEMYVDR
jgi:hypothetical protein